MSTLTSDLLRLQHDVHTLRLVVTDPDRTNAQKIETADWRTRKLEEDLDALIKSQARRK